MMTYLKHYPFKYAINSKYADQTEYNTSVESQMGTTAEQPSVYLFPETISSFVSTGMVGQVKQTTEFCYLPRMRQR